MVVELGTYAIGCPLAVIIVFSHKQKDNVMGDESNKLLGKKYFSCIGNLRYEAFTNNCEEIC